MTAGAKLDKTDVGIDRGKPMKAPNEYSERRERLAADSQIRCCVRNGLDPLRHIRFGFLACVPIVHDFQRGFEMHPGNFYVNARARP